MLMPITREHYFRAKATEAQNPECQRERDCVVSVAFMEFLTGLGVDFSHVGYGLGDTISVYKISTREEAIRDGLIDEDDDWDDLDKEEFTKEIGRASISAGANTLAEEYDELIDNCPVSEVGESKFLKRLPTNVVVVLDKRLKKLVRKGK